MKKTTKKKTIKEMLKSASITISFTREEVDWLAWVMKDVLAKLPGCKSAPAFEKIIDADELLQNVDKVLNEGTKVRKVDARKRSPARPRRKGARR